MPTWLFVLPTAVTWIYMYRFGTFQIFFKWIYIQTMFPCFFLVCLDGLLREMESTSNLHGGDSQSSCSLVPNSHIKFICTSVSVSLFFFLNLYKCSLQVRPGLIALSQQILGPNTLIQGALPEILANTPQDFFDNSMRVIQVSRKHNNINTIINLNSYIHWSKGYWVRVNHYWLKYTFFFGGGGGSSWETNWSVRWKLL